MDLDFNLFRKEQLKNKELLESFNKEQREIEAIIASISDMRINYFNFLKAIKNLVKISTVFGKATVTSIFNDRDIAEALSNILYVQIKDGAILSSLIERVEKIEKHLGIDNIDDL